MADVSKVDMQQAHVLQTNAPPYTQGSDGDGKHVEEAEFRRDVIRAEAMVRLAIGFTMYVLGVKRLEFIDDDLVKFAENHSVEVSTVDGISTYLTKSRK